jgi:hypothetical protein
MTPIRAIFLRPRRERDLGDLAIEVIGLKYAAEDESARLMLADPSVARRIAWHCGVTSSDYEQPDIAIAFIAAVEAGRLRLGRFPALRALSAAWATAGWCANRDAANERVAVWATSGWCAEQLHWRATYRADVRMWLERLRELNGRLRLATEHADAARRALTGDMPAGDVRLRKAG